MVDQQMLERNVSSLGEALANSLREKESAITDIEINEAAHNFIEFIRILGAVDAEQKASKQ